jgi:hypothetical protein
MCALAAGHNNRTNYMLRRADKLLCKTRDCFNRLKLWMTHHRGRLRADAARDLVGCRLFLLPAPTQRPASPMAAAALSCPLISLLARRCPQVYTSHSTIDPLARPGVGGVAQDFTQFINVAGACATSHAADPRSRPVTRHANACAWLTLTHPSTGCAPYIAGGSGLKHTHEVMHAWAVNPGFPQLTVATHSKEHQQVRPAGCIAADSTRSAGPWSSCPLHMLR